MRTIFIRESIHKELNKNSTKAMDIFENLMNTEFKGKSKGKAFYEIVTFYENNKNILK